MRVGIIGAGVSGLVCAQRLLSLADGTLSVSVFEWGRGPGGRTARRRVTLKDGSEVSFDHAAPFFTAKSTEFQQMLSEWEASGHAAQWSDSPEPTYVGTPSNHAICRLLAEKVTGSPGGCMLYGRHVRTARHDAAAGEWIVCATNRGDKSDEEHRFDALVFSDKLLLLPNPYAVLPAADWGPLALPSTLASTGAVVLMLALERSYDTPIRPILTAAHAPLKMLVHDSAKPGRHTTVAAGSTLDLWTAHSTPEYALAHLVGDDPPGMDDEELVLGEMTAAALATLAASVDHAEQSCTTKSENEPIGKPGPSVAFSSVMMWDHAQPAAESRLPTSHLLDASRRAGVCGDFFAGPEEKHSGIEAAALSGKALADALMSVLEK